MKNLSILAAAFRLAAVTPCTNVLRVASAVKAGELIVFGAQTYECTIGTTVTTAGNIPVDVSAKASLVKATGTLTSNNTNVSDAATVTIGSKVYTFKTALTPTEGEVLIGADADASLLNLIRAINHSGTPDTDYKCAAANTQVTAATAVTSHAFAITAITGGTAGNSIATTETSATLSWGAATLASGADTSASDFTTALAAAGGSLAARIRIGANEVLFVDTSATPSVSKACTETLTGSNNAWGASDSYGGAAAPVTPPKVTMEQRVATAHDVTMGNAHFYLNFTPVTCMAAVRTTAGVVKAWDGVLSISGRRVTMDNSGSTDFIAGDVLTIHASE